jgi:hypothetical protein
MAAVEDGADFSAQSKPVQAALLKCMRSAETQVNIGVQMNPEAFASFSRPIRTGLGITSIDELEEHTPTLAEWAALRRSSVFKTMVRTIGGLESVKRIKNGRLGMATNYHHVVDYVREVPDAAMIGGWLILVGIPTGVLFIPHFWADTPRGWHAISGMSDESFVMLATPKQDWAKLAFNLIKQDGSCFHSVAMFPMLPGAHQTANQFSESGAMGTTSRIKISINTDELLRAQEET